MTITDERKEVLDFSEGYYESGISAVVSAKNDKINSADDFKGKTFAVKKVNNRKKEINIFFFI